MPMPNPQPTLPAEGTYTDQELLFISESPKKLFPENQNSNFGLLRRLLTGETQDAVDTLSQLVLQLYVPTATGTNGYLDRWEKQLGLPVAPANATDAQRRNWILQRLRTDLFTVDRIKDLVESFLNFTVGGVPTSITVAGIPTSAGGFTLYGEGGSSTSQYRVYFDPRTYSYQVWIVSSSTPDVVTLNRMLRDITPAGISFTIDNSKSAIIHYGNTVMNKQPAAFYRLGDFNDSSGNGNTGTSFGTFSTVASPGLLTAGKNDDGAAQTFNGTTAYFTAPDQAWLVLGDIFTIEFWIRPVSITGVQIILDKGTNGYMVRSNGGTLELYKSGGALISAATQALANGVTRHVVVRKSGNTVKWTIDNVDRSGAVTPGTIQDTALPLYVGRLQSSSANFLSAAMDELAIYSRMLTDAEITENYNAGKLINP